MRQFQPPRLRLDQDRATELPTVPNPKAQSAMAVAHGSCAASDETAAAIWKHSLQTPASLIRVNRKLNTPMILTAAHQVHLHDGCPVERERETPLRENQLDRRLVEYSNPHLKLSE